MKRGLFLVLAAAALFAAGASAQGGKDSAPAASAKSAEPVTVSWYLRPTAQTDLDAVVNALNEKHLIPKIGVKLDLRRVDPGEYKQKMQLIIASGEKFDLAHSAPRYDYYENVARGAYLPLDDLLKANAPKTLATIRKEYWDAARVSGKIYGILNYQIFARQSAFVYNEDLAKKYGLNLSTVKSPKDIEPYLAAVKADPDYPKGSAILYLEKGFNGDVLPVIGLEQIGTTPGALFTDGSTKVVNMFATEQFKNFCLLMNSWYDKGYINKDAPTAAQALEMSKAGKVAAGLGNLKPGDQAERIAFFGGMKMVAASWSDPFVTSGSVVATMTSLSRTSPNPAKAIQFLELVNTDKEAFNVLAFGIDGKHFKKTGPNRIEQIPNSGYSPNAAWMFGNQFNAFLLPAQIDTVWEDTIKLNDSAKTSAVMGFAFDPTPIKTEIANCAAVVDRYGPALWTGSVAPNSLLPQFLKDLEAAGVAKLIVEQQRQIDAFLASR